MSDFSGKGTNKRAEKQENLEFSRAEVFSRHSLKGTNKRAEKQENLEFSRKESPACRASRGFHF